MAHGTPSIDFHNKSLAAERLFTPAYIYNEYISACISHMNTLMPA